MVSEGPLKRPADSDTRVGPGYFRRYTSVLRYFSPESAISVTTLAPGPSRSATRMRGDDVGARRRPGEERLLPREAPRHLLRVVGRDRQDLVDQRRLPERRDEADPDAFDLVRPRLPPESTGDSAGSTTTIRTLGLWRFSTVATPREDAAVPAQWTKASTSPSRLAPDLLAQRVIARDAVLVVELVRPEGVGLPAQPRAASIMSRISFLVVRPPSLGTIVSSAPNAAI